MRSTSDVNVARTEPLMSPDELDREIPLSQAAIDTVIKSRKAIRDILHGDDPRMLMIVGPCSIHDEASSLEYAGRLAKLARELEDLMVVVMRVYFEKPRTTVGWKGWLNDPRLDGTFDIHEGLRTARRLLLQVDHVVGKCGNRVVLKRRAAADQPSQLLHLAAGGGHGQHGRRGQAAGVGQARRQMLH